MTQSVTSVSNHFLDYDERRKYPRLRIDLPARVSSVYPGKYVWARVYDLAPDGIQIRCDGKIAQLIHPVEKRIDATNQPIVVVSFNLPHHGGEKEIVAKCKICHISAIAAGENSLMAIGSKFIKFKGDCDKLVSQFLIAEMEPAC